MTNTSQPPALLIRLYFLLIMVWLVYTLQVALSSSACGRVPACFHLRLRAIHKHGGQPQPLRRSKRLLHFAKITHFAQVANKNLQNYCPTPAMQEDDVKLGFATPSYIVGASSVLQQHAQLGSIILYFADFCVFFSAVVLRILRFYGFLHTAR